MPRVDQRMPAAQSVQVSQTTTFRLPIGRRYHALYLLGSGTAFAPSDLAEIRILANNKVIQRFTGADRDMMNQFDGRNAAAISAAVFNLVIPFDRYGILTKAGEEETALNTGSIDPNTQRVINALSVEIDIGASPTGTLALGLYATTSEQVAGGPGTLPFILKSVRDYAGAAEYDVSDFPRGGVQTQFIDKIFLIPSTSTLENLKVSANNYKIFERTAALNERAQRDGIRVPQAGVYAIDRTEHGYGGDPFDLRGLDDWRLQYTTGAALSVTTYTHYLGTLGD